MYAPKLPDVDFTAFFFAVLFFTVLFYVLGWREKLLKDKAKAKNSWEEFVEKFLKD